MQHLCIDDIFSRLDFESSDGYFPGSILFGRKNSKNLKKLDIRRGDIMIKQHSTVTHLGCILDENLSGESMATRMLGKIMAS